MENKLYTKIEICNSLVKFDHLAIKPLIGLFGKIGKNQHQTISEKDFKKNSYPLPRDIASRTIIRIGKKAMPDLLMVIDENDTNKISEAIDAIGFINFYDKHQDVYTHLYACFHRNIDHDLIRWKIIRACSGISESETFLKELQKTEKNISIIREINRSLFLIDKRK